MKPLAAACFAIAAVALLVAAKEAQIGPFKTSTVTSLAPPGNLSQTNAVRGWAIREGEWMKTATVRFGVRRPRRDRGTTLQIQLAKDGSSPSGRPSVSASAANANQVTVNHLADGTYEWWARFSKGNVVSRWIPYGSGTAFGIDTNPPSKPVISSSTDPNSSKVYRSASPQFAWSSNDHGAGIQGYWYQLQTHKAGPAHPTVLTTSNHLLLHSVSSGRYYFAVAARDRAGNWSGVSRFPVRIDSTPPTVTALGFSTFTFNPQYNPMTVNFRVDSPANIRIGIYRQSDNALVRFAKLRSRSPNQLLHFTWNGRDDHGRLAPETDYSFFVRTTDSAGNTSLKEYSGLQIVYKRIVVSLSRQKLWAWDGHKLLLSSLVTTGNRALPTPTGHFTIMAKYHPFTFVSPFPTTSKYYYQPSPVSYAMLFRKGGYYIHDAPWRTAFGPGTNSQVGIPGQNYTGTHGCVNVPPNVSQELYAWAPIGTPVVVKK